MWSRNAIKSWDGIDGSCACDSQSMQSFKLEFSFLTQISPKIRRWNIGIELQQGRFR